MNLRRASSLLIGTGLLTTSIAVMHPLAADAAFPGTNARVVFDSTRTGAVNVFSVDPNNTSDVRMLTSSNNIDELPFGSPDGTKIVFRSDRANPGNGQGNIYISSAAANLDQNTFPPDGATALTTGGADDKDPSFVDDTTVVYSHKDVGGNYRLFTVLVSTQVSTLLLAPPAGCDDAQAVVNPVTVTQFAFTRTCVGQAAQVYLYDSAVALSGTNPKNLTAAAGITYPVTTDDGPDWAPDGSRIALSGTGGPALFGGLNQLYSIKPDGSDRQTFWPTLTAGTGKNDRFPAYSPDGTKLAFTRQAATTGSDVWTSELASLASTSTASSGPRDITPARGPDQHPNWLRITTPPVEVPEVPLVPLISLSAALLLGGVMLRRRAHAAT